jgi:2-dehydropantoate 2-reductase
VGRVALHPSSSNCRNYWWQRRKWESTVEYLKGGSNIQKRLYIGQRIEPRTGGSSNDIPFLGVTLKSPRRMKAEMLARVSMDDGIPGVGDLERFKQLNFEVGKLNEIRRGPSNKLLLSIPNRGRTSSTGSPVTMESMIVIDFTPVRLCNSTSRETASVDFGLPRRIGQPFLDHEPWSEMKKKPVVLAEESNGYTRIPVAENSGSNTSSNNPHEGTGSRGSDISNPGIVEHSKISPAQSSSPMAMVAPLFKNTKDQERSGENGDTDRKVEKMMEMGARMDANQKTRVSAEGAGLAEPVAETNLAATVLPADNDSLCNAPSEDKIGGNGISGMVESAVNLKEYHINPENTERKIPQVDESRLAGERHLAARQMIKAYFAKKKADLDHRKELLKTKRTVESLGGPVQAVTLRPGKIRKVKYTNLPAKGTITSVSHKQPAENMDGACQQQVMNRSLKLKYHKERTKFSPHEKNTFDPLLDDHAPPTPVEDVREKTYSSLWTNDQSVENENENPGTLAAVTTDFAKETSYQPFVDPALSVQQPISRTIHVLGTNPLGMYIAHSLSDGVNAPPVTLLMHRPLLMQRWHAEGAAIRIVRNGKTHTKSSFNLESCATFGANDPFMEYPGFGNNLEHTAEPPDTVIENLIVTISRDKTLVAINSIKHRLRPYSTICFLQEGGGLGIIEDINYHIFPDPEVRPAYILGNTSHHVYGTALTYTVIERKPGEIYLTTVPRELPSPPQGELELPLRKAADNDWPTPRSRYILRQFTRVYDLSAVGVRTKDFLSLQFERLAINAVIGPLSVMYDCTNDRLLYNWDVSHSMRALLNEISAVLQALPELKEIDRLTELYSVKRLEELIVRVLHKTGKNRSAMLEAVNNGHRTEIDYYNGYLIKRGAELGIPCPCLEMSVAMVKGKQRLKYRESTDWIPWKN